jgi:hypothetical protein
MVVPAGSGAAFQGVAAKLKCDMDMSLSKVRPDPEVGKQVAGGAGRDGDLHSGPMQALLWLAIAIAGAAAWLRLGDDGAIADARVALGGIATKPWRSREAERALIGRPVNAVSFRAAADAALAGAVPRRHKAFKIELAKRTLVRALTRAGALA